MRDEIDYLNERVAWLEREMVRLIWALKILCAGSAGVAVGYGFNKDLGWFSMPLGIVVLLAVAFYLHRHEFKGAPEHVKHMDP